MKHAMKLQQPGLCSQTLHLLHAVFSAIRGPEVCCFLFAYLQLAQK